MCDVVNAGQRSAKTSSVGDETAERKLGLQQPFRRANKSSLSRGVNLHPLRKTGPLQAFPRRNGLFFVAHRRHGATIISPTQKRHEGDDSRGRTLKAQLVYRSFASTRIPAPFKPTDQLTAAPYLMLLNDGWVSAVMVGSGSASASRLIAAIATQTKAVTTKVARKQVE